MRTLGSHTGTSLGGVLKQCQSGILEPQRQDRIAKDGRTTQVSVIASALVNAAGETYAIATTERGAAILGSP
jgi:two-component system CheB/CheR fusion protein